VSRTSIGPDTDARACDRPGRSCMWNRWKKARRKGEVSMGRGNVDYELD
jgi:hypothetical protein